MPHTGLFSRIRFDKACPVLSKKESIERSCHILPVVENVLHGCDFLWVPDRLLIVSMAIVTGVATYRCVWTILFATRFPVFVRWNLTPATTAVFGVGRCRWSTSVGTAALVTKKTMRYKASNSSKVLVPGDFTSFLPPSATRKRTSSIRISFLPVVELTLVFAPAIPAWLRR